MSVFERKNSPFWQYDFWLNGQRAWGSTKIRTGEKGSKAAAKKFERERMGEVEGGTYHKRGSGTQLLREFIYSRLLPAIEVERAEKPRTVEFYQQTFGKICEDAIADYPLFKIGKAEITDFKVRAKKSGLAVATINRRLACLQKALRRAVEEELIPRAPKFEKLSGEHRRESVILGLEKELFISGLPEPLRNPVEFLFETGLRVTELCTLTKDRVSFDGPFPFIKIHRSVSKSKEDRFVPLTQRAQQIILEEMDRSRSAFVFVRWGRGVKGSRSGRDRPGFHNAEKAFMFPLVRHTISAAFTARREEMGLPKDVVLHTTRHSAATRVGATGAADVFTLMAAFGWRSPEIAKRYVHPTRETISRAFLSAENMDSTAKVPTENSNRLLTNGK